MAYIQKKDEKSFRSIVLDALESILVLSRTEFRGGFHNIIYKGDSSIKQYVPSSMKSYSQAVEHFAAVLIPMFDEEMEEEYNMYLEMKSEEEEKGETVEVDKEVLKLNKLLFIALNMLLSRKKYLQGSMRTEGPSGKKDKKDKNKQGDAFEFVDDEFN